MHELSDERAIDGRYHHILRHRAAGIADIVDLCSRKYPQTDERGRFIIRPNGRPEKVPRFGGDLNEYYNRQFGNPLACWIKWDDSVEGVSTRTLPDTLDRPAEKSFSLDSNEKYAAERRYLYGRRANDVVAMQQWPGFAEVFAASDSMLGINLVILESFNDYLQNKALNPAEAMRMRTDSYSEDAWDAHRHIPPGWRSDRIQTGRIERLAAADPRLRLFLEKVVYPSMKLFRTDLTDLSHSALPSGVYSVPSDICTSLN